MSGYNIMLNECVIGTAEIETEGMYLKVKARCIPPDAQTYKLILLCNSMRVDLGVCVPENNYFVVNKRIQRKLIGEGALRFILETRRKQKESLFIPIDAEKPFDYLDRLPSGFFEKRGAVCGIAFR